jgi:hypothetical protein
LKICGEVDLLKNNSLLKTEALRRALYRPFTAASGDRRLTRLEPPAPSPAARMAAAPPSSAVELAQAAALLGALPLLAAEAFFGLWLAGSAPPPPPPPPPRAHPPAPASLLPLSRRRAPGGARAPSRWPRRLFALSFALSLDLLALAVCEVSGTLAPALRERAWRVVLVAFVALQVLALPFAAALRLAAALLPAAASWRARAPAAAALEAAFLWAFWRLGALFPLLVEPERARGGGGAAVDGAPGGDGPLALLGNATAAAAADAALAAAAAASSSGSSFASSPLVSLALAGSVGRLGVAGVAAAAVLSGYGAVATPYGYLAALLHAVSEADVRTKRHTVRRLLERLQARRAHAAALEDAAAAAAGAGAVGAAAGGGGGSAAASFSTSLAPSFSRPRATSAAAAGAFPFGAAAAAALEDARRVVRVAEELQRESQAELEELERALAQQQWGRTALGRGATALGYALSVYAAFKTLAALANVFLGRDPTQLDFDPVTRGLELTLVAGLGVPRAEAERWLRPASFVFVGTLVCASVRGFLNAAARAAGRASRTLGLEDVGSGDGARSSASDSPPPAAGLAAARSRPVGTGAGASAAAGAGVGAGAAAEAGASEGLVLLLASIMGCYCVSVLLLLRAQMPEEFRRGVTRALGANVRFGFFHRLFDVAFVASVAAAAVAHAVAAALRASRVSVSAEERDDFFAAGGAGGDSAAASGAGAAPDGGGGGGGGGDVALRIGGGGRPSPPVALAAPFAASSAAAAAARARLFASPQSSAKWQ